MIRKLIQYLSADYGVPDQTLRRIENAYRENRAGLAEAVLSTKEVSERSFLEILGRIYDLPIWFSLDPDQSEDSWTGKVGSQFLKNQRLVPLVRKRTTTIIAVNDPSDLAPVDDLTALAGIGAYDLVLAPRNEILSAIDFLYDKSGHRERQLVKDMEGNEYTIIDEIGPTADLLDDASDAPVIRLVNHMISQAVKAGASDIHIEPFQDTLKIRYRIDGILYNRLTPPKGVQASLVSRIKVMASMNIAEKRVPQDGRAQVRFGDQEIDIRISTVPTAFGERLVMRLLNKSSSFLSLSQFGLEPPMLERFNHIIRQSNGIILVTGPTGSGKTTTLYAALSEINSSDKNIITIEDPVEYNLEGIGQIQVNTKTGVTFAKGLRSVVRQDPDVVLVGEIRDGETASIAIQSALTGHLVFSTLHTNDAAGAITRLVDLGIEPYLISSSVNTVIAQRLVRVLCPYCREEQRLTERDLSSLNGSGRHMQEKTVFKPRGCPKCFETGYSGRQAIFEILDLDDELQNLILSTSDANHIKEEAVKKGMTTLRQDGLAKVLQGITSVQEVLRVTQE